MSARIGSRVYTILVAGLLMISTAAYGQTTWYVDDDAPGDPEPGDSLVSDPDEDGSAAHPFDAIQEAIDASADGDTVMVLDGTYTGFGNKNIQYGGKAITVQSENGPDDCIIDCEGDGRGFNCHHASDCSNESVLDGFTVRNACLNNGESYGGGFYVQCDLNIRNCIIENNDISGGWDGQLGGGIFCYDCDAVIENCLIRANAAQGIFLSGSNGTPIIRGCTIIENSRSGIGIGYHSSARIIDCTITNNNPEEQDT